MDGNMAAFRYRPTKPTETKGYFIGLIAGMTVGFVFLMAIVLIWAQSLPSMFGD